MNVIYRKTRYKISLFEVASIDRARAARIMVYDFFILYVRIPRIIFSIVNNINNNSMLAIRQCVVLF